MLTGKQSHWCWWDDSPAKGTCPKAWQLEFYPQDPHSERRTESPKFHTPWNAHTHMHTHKCTHKEKKHYMKTTTTKQSTSSGVEDLAVECHCPLHRRPCSKWHVCVVITSEQESLGYKMCMHISSLFLWQFVCVHFVVIQTWWGNSVETVTWIIQLPSHITKRCCNHNTSNQFQERYTL